MAYVKAPIPTEVYHLTTKEHLPDILDDGQIRRFGDSECWFCETPEKLRRYMEQTVLCEGKPYYAVDGSVQRYSKFKPEDHAILKLTPCHREGNWYRWNQEIPRSSPPELVKAAEEFSKLKIGYRGDLRFRDAQALDVTSFLQGQLVSQRVYTTRELWQRLDEKLERNLQDYQNKLYQMSPGLLVGKAEEIAANALCYGEMKCTGEALPRQTLSYLLQFEDPLEVMRDRWVLEQSWNQGERFQCAVENLRTESHAVQEYSLDEKYAQSEKHAELQMNF